MQVFLLQLFLLHQHFVEAETPNRLVRNTEIRLRIFHVPKYMLFVYLPRFSDGLDPSLAVALGRRPQFVLPDVVTAVRHGKAVLLKQKRANNQTELLLNLKMDSCSSRRTNVLRFGQRHSVCVSVCVSV